jgi:hypothetical protein
MNEDASRKAFWIERHPLAGFGILVMLIFIGVSLYVALEHQTPEEVPPPTVEITPAPVEVQYPSPFFLLAWVVGVGLLVTLAAVLVWRMWLRTSRSNDKPDRTRL